MSLQAVPLPQRSLSFREQGLSALETHQGADLISFLGMIHDQAMAEADEMAAAARNAVVQVSASAAVDQHMLADVLAVMRPVMHRSAENSARATHFAGVIESVRALLNESESADTAPAIEQLRRLIDVNAATPPFRPAALGFVPSTQYSVGHFRHTHTRQEWHLPFSGYATCEEAPDRPMAVHVAFLHKGVVQPRPKLYAEFGLVLEHME